MIAVPCRKCWPCQLQRRREWIARACNEVIVAPKTWLFTGTFKDKPETPAVVVEAFQKYMKRLRHKGRYFRYVMVVETGDLRGRLHCHALLHTDLGYKDVRGLWNMGFAHAKLLRPVIAAGRLDEDTAKQVHYVAGYITGDIKFPVRASLHYGKLQGQPLNPEGPVRQRTPDREPQGDTQGHGATEAEAPASAGQAMAPAGGSGGAISPPRKDRSCPVIQSPGPVAGVNARARSARNGG